MQQHLWRPHHGMASQPHGCHAGGSNMRASVTELTLLQLLGICIMPGWAVDRCQPNGQASMPS